MRIALTLILLTLLPGAPLAVALLRNVRDGLSWVSIAGTLGLLWSAAVTFGLTVLHVPLTLLSVGGANLLPALLLITNARARRSAQLTLMTLLFTPRTSAIVLLTIGVLLLPFLTVQNGLPTGDVQQAIFWGSRVAASARLPDYTQAIRLNRDPGDFATPALHTLTAAVMRLTGDPLRGPAWLAFLSALFLAGLAAAVANLLAPRYQSFLPTLSFVIAATNARALRYTAAPGYHYQNIFGELFLLTAFLGLLTAVGGRGTHRSVLLTAAAVALLPLTHQFSAFLAALFLPVVFLLLVIRYRAEVAGLLAHRFGAFRRGILGSALVGAAVLATLALRSPFLSHTLGKVVTAAPHLRGLLIPPSEIPELLGIPFVFLGGVGILLTVIAIRRREFEWRWSLLLVWIGLVFLASQGPRWLLDIPSARTLFYLATPLAVVAAAALVRATERIRLLWPRSAPVLVPAVLALALAPTVGIPLNAARQGLDAPTSGITGLTNHQHPRNTTLTPETLALLDFLNQHPPVCSDSAHSDSANPAPCADALLVTSRRGTWTLLSPYRMFARVGSDIAVTAGEVRQSAQRRTQYETLLDFEKIVTLGSSPVIRPLLERHRIALLLGKNGLTTEVFRQNPLLEPVFATAETTLFRVREGTGVPHGSSADPDAEFLLSRATLANDVGDPEDAFVHLPLPVFAPQTSDSREMSGRTIREFQSREIRLQLNAGRYIPSFWDGNGDHAVDRPIKLLLRVLPNGARGRIFVGDVLIQTFVLPGSGSPHTLHVTIPASALQPNDAGAFLIRIALDDGSLLLDLVAAGLSS
ncbi:MAG: hypothetical protein Q8R32_03605 [bacterium]|nr:hypothetical protein [bacterium]